MLKSFDVFICHASEDKDNFVRPLAEALRRLSISVWYDEFSLGPGDSLSQGIDKGITGSKFGIVIISQAFIGKNWPEHELRGLVNRDVEEDLKILPIWHGIGKKEVSDFSPSLADKWALDTRKDNAQEAAIKLLRTVRPDIYEDHPRAELEKLASGEAIQELQSEIEELRNQMAEYQCPYCGAAISHRIDAPIDAEEKHWDVVESFECGFQTFAGMIQSPCSSDPNFPELDDYKIVIEPSKGMPNAHWVCNAYPVTEMACKVFLKPGYGKTKEDAERKVKANYLYSAGRMSNQAWIEILMNEAE